MEMLLASLLGIVIACIAGIYHTRNANKIKNAEALLKDCRIQGKTLYVEKQNKLFSSVLSTKKHEVSEYKRDPLKVHVGAATVGGVTTGGVYTTGGGISQTDYRDGRVELIYKQVRKPKENEVHLSTFIDENEVESIVLSAELAEKAKMSAIKEYLSGNKIRIVEDVKPSNYYTLLMKSGQTLAAVSQLNLEKSAGYPTKEKCQIIIDWLCEE